ncbi:hypothetical protein LCGC14_2745740 [marine sediment metagenome]|uniref:Ku domain-containing protein n=1 Tax=marine sediment metagenome TaxID=412755 RepID=A0A0F9BC05_9ZZZZ
MRSMWKGTISFGMVAIPIKLYSSTTDKDVSMNQLHEECGTKIKVPKMCPTCDEKAYQAINKELLSPTGPNGTVNYVEVIGHVDALRKGLDAGEIIKGYPLGEDKFVPITKEDLECLKLDSVKSIQIMAFIDDIDGIEDPRYFEKPYFLSPEEVGTKAFVLFVQAMEKAGVMGVGKITIATKEHLCVVSPFEGVLLLQTLKWADELSNFDEILVSGTVSDAEMEMATKLIASMTRVVDLTEYKDSYREALVDLITAKLEGKTIEKPKATPKDDRDLAEQLIASLNAIEVEK